MQQYLRREICGSSSVREILLGKQNFYLRSKTNIDFTANDSSFARSRNICKTFFLRPEVVLHLFLCLRRALKYKGFEIKRTSPPLSLSPMMLGWEDNLLTHCGNRSMPVFAGTLYKITGIGELSATYLKGKNTSCHVKNNGWDERLLSYCLYRIQVRYVSCVMNRRDQMSRGKRANTN